MKINENTINCKYTHYLEDVPRKKKGYLLITIIEKKVKKQTQRLSLHLDERKNLTQICPKEIIKLYKSLIKGKKVRRREFHIV